MKAQLSLNVTRRDLNAFIACLLSFSLLMMPFVPAAAAASRRSERQTQKSSQAQPATSNVVAVNAALPAPAPAPVPAITATKAATILNDDGDNKADPNASPNPAEKIEYTVTITNNGTDATNVTFSDTIDPHTTLVPGSINTQPIADPDTYAASGNIPITLAAPGVLGNDRDPDTGDATGLTVTKVQGNAANVGVATDTTAVGRGGVKGSVTVAANGGFTYEPAPGFTNGADTFTYEISDGTKTDTGTVTINITGMVWFISNNVGGLNRGTFTNPFTTIASFNTANAGTGAVPDPKNGDFISLRTGTGTYTETDGINLRAQQKLIGNAIQFNTVFAAAADSSSAYTAFAGVATAAPNIVTSGGNGVDLSTDNTVRGLNIGNTPGFFKVNGAAVGSPIINAVGLSGTGGALNVSTSGAFGANVTFGQFESTSSPTSNLNLVNVTGTLAATSAGTGLSGSAAGSAAVNISGGTVSFTYGGNVSKTNTGALVSVSGAHSTGTLTFQTGTLSATGGTGLQFDNADGTYNFNGTTTLAGGDAGIDLLNGSSGTFSFASGTTITSPSGTAFNVGTGNPSVTYAGSITQNTSGQRAVNIDGTTGSAINFTDVTTGVVGGASSTGVNINNANGNVSFTKLTLGTSGARMTNQAVTIAGGSGSKALGTVSIFTTGTAEGIHSTTTTGAISITAGTVNSAGAAAINIAGTSAASRTPLNVQLDSVAANGGAKGLILLNTSATGSPGGFRVNGSGTTDGSGGTIQNTTTRGADIQTADSIVLKNMNFTNANSSVDGGSAGACDDTVITGCNSAIYLNGLTTLATFDNLNLTGTMVENGVTAINVANFKFDNSVVDGAGNEVHESGIEAQNLSGTATVNNTEIRFSETDAFAVTNNDTSVNLTISSSTFRDSQTQFSGGPVNTNGEGGFQFRSNSVAAGAPTATINVLNSSFLRLRTQALQVFSGDDTTINLDVTGCTIDSQSDIGTGFDINADDTSTFNFNILNNPTIQSRNGAAVNITSFLDGHMEGRVNNNPDIEVLGGAGIAVRLVAQETSDMVVEINGNTVSNVNGTEDTTIDVQSRFQTARVDATITGNTVTTRALGIAGINLIVGSSTAGESNITCGDVANNNVTNAAANSTRAFRIRNSDISNTNRMFLEGFVEAGTALQDTEATWSGRGNTPTGVGEVAASLTGTAVGPLAPPGGVCFAVDTPSDFSTLTTPSKTDQFASAPAPANGNAALATASVQNAPAQSAQPSLISRAVTSLASFAGGVLSLIEPTAHASSEQPAHVTTQPAFSEAGNQKLASRTANASSRKVLSNHAKLSPRAVAAAPFVSDVDRTIGTLRAGDSVTITFQVTVNNPPNLTGVPPGPAQVSNHGEVHFDGDGGTPVSSNTVNTPVDLFDTTNTLASDLNPSNFGDLVTFTATIAESPAQPTVNPTATVDFVDTSNGNAVVCNDVALTSGSAQCQTSTLTAGTHNIRADYSGDGNFDPQQSNVVAQVVNACTSNPIVTSTADSGAGSLREAVAQVCAGTTITFDIAGAGPHTITLASEIAVAKNVTINNVKNNVGGEKVTVSGANTSRVFNINSGKTVAIIGLTLTGGNTTGDGGAILNDGALTIVNSTLSGNHADTDGGAISTTATGTNLTLINTTLSGNSAGGSGGGLITLGGTVSIINSTITNNTADSDNGGNGDGGGIRIHAGTVTLKNTIVSGNFNEDGTTDAADDVSGTADPGSSSNLIGTAAGLGPLADNGGLTQTHALLPTSPAVEAGSNANLPQDTFDLDGDTVTAETLPVDQRGLGFPRNADSFDLDTDQVVDIGAFELHPSIEDIPNQATNEDTVKLVVFNLGDDTGTLITGPGGSVTATSSNTTLVPNANLSFSGSGGSRTLQITPAASQSGTTTITVTVTATNGRTATDTFDLSVGAVNDPPVGTDNTVTTDEDTVYTFTVPDFGFTDPNDSPANSLLAVKITTLPGAGALTNNNVAVNAGDFIPVANISGGLLKFTPVANANGIPYTSFTFQVQDDGGGSDLDPTPNTMTINVTAINDPPSFTIAADPPAVAQDAGPQTVNNFATSISAGPNEAGQTLTFNLSQTGTTGTLTFSTAPAINATTGALTYTATNGTNGTATFSVTLSDNGSNTPPNSNTSAAQSFTITVAAPNASPVVTTTAGNLLYTENAGAVAIDPGLTVTDSDDANLVGASVAITAGFVSAQDTLAFTNQLGITGNYNSGTGVLTLSGSTTVANYQTALRSVTYQNSSDDPTASRTITFTASDGVSVPGSATRGIAITAVNDAPVNTVPPAQSTNEDTAKVFSSGNGNQISVADVDLGANPIKITLTVTNGTLTLNGTVGLVFTTGTGSGDATMVFTGMLGNVNTALNGLTFNPTADFTGSASLQIVSDDQGNTGTGGAKTDTDSVTITVNAQNDAPVVTATAGNLSYTENDAATAIDPGLTVTDADNTNLTGATVAITANFASGQDVLAFTNQNGINGNYNSGTGVLTLTGTATVANYQTALRSVTYQNSSDDPSTATRTVSFKVNDGTNDSNTATRGITITAVNDAPVNVVPGSQSTNQNTPLTFSSGNGNQISVTDADAGTNDVQVTLTATNGTLTLNGTSGLNFGCGGCSGDGTADATMTFQGTITNINTALNGMTYTPNLGFSGAASLTITSNDLGNTGSGGAKTDTDVVNIQVATNVSIQDASVAEPKNGTVNMIFTVTLSAPAPAGGASVNYATQDIIPASINTATAGQDYTATSGTVNFAAGEQFKTILVSIKSDNKKGENNESFQVVLSNPVNATIADGTAIGTIIENEQAGTILISELRTSGPGGAGDDFVEIYNNSTSPQSVGGFGLFKMGATCSDAPVLIGVIPAGTTLQPRGHFLFTGSAYSLAGYAAGDATLLQDIESDRNVAIFSTSSLGAISSANRRDAVGFGANTGGTCDLFREGTTLTPLSGSTLEHSYFRDECGKKGNPSTFGNCPTGGLTKDSNVNADDFIFVDTNATATPAGQRLGAPGPQNFGSPRMTFDVLALLLDASKSASGTPNRVRDTSAAAMGPNAAQGTLSIRRRFQNNTGGPVNTLRIRVVDISTTFVSGGVADLRLLSSSDITVNVSDSATCTAAGFASTPCNVTVRGTTLETPPNQPLGGGFNSSATTITITTGTPLAPGASVNLQLLLGVQGAGSFKFFFNVEALP